MKLHFLRERRSPPATLPGAGPPAPKDVFLSHWNNLGKQRLQLLVISLLSLSALIVVLVSYVRLAHASRFVPFVYVVDRSGEVLALGAAHPITTDDDAVVYNSLETFITSVRAVYHDQLAERAALKKAYVFLPGDNPEATSTGFLETYMATNDPRVLADRFSRVAEIVSILKLPGRPREGKAAAKLGTWRIRWRETTYPMGATPGDTSEWEAFATVRQHPKKIVEAFDPNPFGVYIDHLSWSRLTPVARP